MTSRYICSSSLMRARVPAAAPAKPAPPLPGGLRRAYARSRSCPERLLHLVEPGDQPIDVVGNRIEIEARARRRGDAEPCHQGLRAVVARADGDALPVEDLRDVVGVHALEPEAVGLGDSRRARLELVRQLVPARAL